MTSIPVYCPIYLWSDLFRILFAPGFLLFLESACEKEHRRILWVIAATRCSMLTIEYEVLREFEVWFESEAMGDSSYFANVTTKQLISRAGAISDKCVDELLTLSRRGVGLRDWITVNLVQRDSGNQFPPVRRKGGDDDRGFSPALNAEMRKRHGSGE